MRIHHVTDISFIDETNQMKIRDVEHVGYVLQSSAVGTRCLPAEKNIRL